MKWLDSYEVSVQSGQASRLFTRAAWRAMTPAQQQAAADVGGRVRGIRYHLDSHPWLYLGATNLEADEAADAWTLWDMRTNPPTPLAVGIPTLDLAQKFGKVVAHSRLVRLALGTAMVGAATVAALAQVWRRERPRG